MTCQTRYVHQAAVEAMGGACSADTYERPGRISWVGQGLQDPAQSATDPAPEAQAIRRLRQARRTQEETRLESSFRFKTGEFLWSGQGELNPRLILGRDACRHNTLAASQPHPTSPKVHSA